MKRYGQQLQEEMDRKFGEWADKLEQEQRNVTQTHDDLQQANLKTLTGELDENGEINGWLYYMLWFGLAVVWWLTACLAINFWNDPTIYNHDMWAKVCAIIWLLTHPCGLFMLLWRVRKGVKAE